MGKSINIQSLIKLEIAKQIKKAAVAKKLSEAKSNLFDAVTLVEDLRTKKSSRLKSGEKILVLAESKVTSLLRELLEDEDELDTELDAVADDEYANQDDMEGELEDTLSSVDQSDMGDDMGADLDGDTFTDTEDSDNSHIYDLLLSIMENAKTLYMSISIDTEVPTYLLEKLSAAEESLGLASAYFDEQTDNAQASEDASAEDAYIGGED